MNALEDADITRALYRAAQDGVRVELVVRDTCRLRPGLPGISENVTVVSVVGRFLEHARIYHFHNGGADEYFIGSADCMKRNLEHRVEVLVPVDDPLARETLSTMLDSQLAPNRNTWLMQPDGSYVRSTDNTTDRGCQQALYEWITKRDSSPKLVAARRRRRFGRRIARVHTADGTA